MLEIILIRHGQTDWNRDGRIMGARPIPLNEKGRRQIESLSGSMEEIELEAIYSSPILRAWESARLLARGRKLRMIKAPEIGEIDYGDWVGKRFEDIKREKSYQIYYSTPGRAKVPGGERMIDVYNRSVKFIENLKKQHPAGRVALVSHADVIKAILVHYLDLDLNDLLKIRIDNGSLSSILLNSKGAKILAINSHADLKGLFLRTDQLQAPQKKR